MIPFTQITFPCKKCGASKVFYAASGVLRCEYCKSETKITPPDKEIVEYSLNNALSKITKMPNEKLKCPSCSASFTLKPFIRSSRCPFCKTPVISNLDIFMPIAAESVLPFKITKKEAQEIFNKWTSSLWFAPKKFKDSSKSSLKIFGVYLPYWTFDSDTTSLYRGLRGDIYYERVYDAGRRRYVKVAKTRWSAVSGEIKRGFDDVLVGATLSIPRKLANSLSPWDLENLLPYSEKYLSGFESEIYQIGVDDGFKRAKEFMRYSITNSIRAKIGGDKQQITFLRVFHKDMTYKHILLPIWSGEFVHDKRTYRFAINARSGKIKGERPYNKTQILVIIVTVLIVILVLFFLAENQKF